MEVSVVRNFLDSVNLSNLEVQDVSLQNDGDSLNCVVSDIDVSKIKDSIKDTDYMNHVYDLGVSYLKLLLRIYFNFSWCWVLLSFRNSTVGLSIDLELVSIEYCRPSGELVNIPDTISYNKICELDGGE